MLDILSWENPLEAKDFYFSKVEFCILLEWHLCS
jgi:hypothetical protein